MPEEIGQMNAGVAVPSAILTARDGVQIENGVYTMGSTQGNDSVKMSKSVGEEGARGEIGFEVAVIEGDTKAVEAEGREEGGVSVRKKVLKELHE